MASEQLNVIALISGGKDSFFNLIHCIEHGHRIVALANLFPGSDALASDSTGPGAIVIPDGQSPFRQEDATGAKQETGGQTRSEILCPEGFQHIDPETWIPPSSARDGHDSSQTGEGSGESSDTDLNSFMYQTVGHAGTTSNGEACHVA